MSHLNLAMTVIDPKQRFKYEQLETFKTYKKKSGLLSTVPRMGVIPGRPPEPPAPSTGADAPSTGASAPMDGAGGAVHRSGGSVPVVSAFPQGNDAGALADNRSFVGPLGMPAITEERYEDVEFLRGQTL